MRKRLVLLLAAALIVVIVLLYPSIGCRVSEEQIRTSALEPFAVPVLQGYAIGFSFNLTNLGGCELIAESIQVNLQNATYPDGRATLIDTTEGKSLYTTLAPGQTKKFSYSFDSYFGFSPTKLGLRIEISFGEAGRVAVFDGELLIPQN